VSYRLTRVLHKGGPANDDLIVCVSVACAYASFFIAGSMLVVSGVLSCCTAGRHFYVCMYVCMKVVYVCISYELWHIYIYMYACMCILYIFTLICTFVCVYVST